jgi:hypothetical protein
MRAHIIEKMIIDEKKKKIKDKSLYGLEREREGSRNSTPKVEGIKKALHPTS